MQLFTKKSLSVSRLLQICIMLCISINSLAQIPSAYQVGKWYKFKPAAVTYTMDDNTSNQLPVAIPLFNQYNFKTTMFVVTNWGPNWSQLNTASNNGHEVASHTVSHTTLTTINTSQQDTEYKNSQNTINSNIPNAKCLTVAYPNCNTGDIPTIQKYYIAGRNCSNQIISSSPTDFYNLSSIICGNTGVNTANDMNSKVSSAKSSGGWCVFLIHGIDSDGGYSPLASSVLSSHLSYVNTNTADYWVGTFLNVVKYIKERNGMSISETSVSNDSLRMTPTDNLDNSIYNAAVTVRRQLPSGWTEAKVYLGNTLQTSTIVTVNNVKYIEFDVVPDKGVYAIANKTSSPNCTTVAPSVTSTVSYTQGASATALTATGTALKWYTLSTGGTASSTAPVPSTTTVGSVIYYVSQTLNNCEGPRAAITVNVTSGSCNTTAPSVTSPVTYTQGASATALTANGTALKWYTGATGGTALSTAPVPSTTTVGSVIYYVSQTLNNCEGPRASITVNVTSGSNGGSCNETGEGAYYTGVYRNMFKELLNKSDAEINTKVNSAFQQIFYGSSTQKLFYEVGTDMAYILDVNNNDVRSEGMSYGMMICAQLDKQAEFNKIWKWAKTYMQYGANNNYDGYFAWQMNTNGTIKGNSPASDGEAYFITSLFFAANRWGNGDGIFNYEAEAQNILNKIMSKTGAGSVYNLFNTNSKLITFVPYGDSYSFTDPSYNLPGFWELWSRWSKTNQSFWAQTPATSRKLLRDASHSSSGLTTDYSNFDGTPKEVSYNTDADRFMYDAWRSIMNIGMDYHWFKSDAQQPIISERYLTFFKNQGSSYKNHYDWNGANAGGDHSTGLVACNAVAALAVNNTSLTTPFVQELWNTAIPTGTYRYYDGMLYMLGLLNVSGNFKVWKPACPCTAPEAPAVSNISYCQGASASALSATATSGNVLQWYGTNATGGTASTTAPTPGTSVAGTTTYYVSQKTTTGNCESPRAAIVVTIDATVVPTVELISASGTTIESASISPLLTTTSTNAGANATYTWKKNGQAISGGASNTYQVPAPVNDGDMYTVTLNSTAKCANPTSVNSNTITFKVILCINPPTPQASDISYCKGATALPLTAIGAAGNILQWYGTSAAGGTANSTAPTPNTSVAGNSRYYVSQKTTTGNCESPRKAIVVTVNETLTPTIELVSESGTEAEPGETPLLISTSTNAGTTPVYVWKKNDEIINGASSETYQIVSPVEEGDSYSVTLTSSANCASPASVTSNKITFSIITSININQSSEFAVYPNPARGSIQVQGINGGFEYLIVDNFGRQVDSGSSNSLIEISHLKSGIYGLVITDSKNKEVVKVIIE